MAILTSQEIVLKMRMDFTLPHMRLHAAVRDGNINAVRNLLQGEALQELNNVRTSWGTPLHVAIWCDNLLILRVLLDAGADPTLELGGTDSADTALQLAAQRGHLDINRELWGRMAPEYHANEPWSCLVQAARYGQAALVSWYLDVWHGWSASTTEKALGAAVGRWHYDTVDVLLRNVDYNETIRYRMLENACCLKAQLPEQLREEYCDEDFLNQRHIIERLIGAGLDPNRSSSETPLLHKAAHYHHQFEALSTLLDQGADPDVKDYRGETVLHELAFPIFIKAGGGQRAVHDRAIELLLRHGASISVNNAYGETPLHLAAFAFELDKLRPYLSPQPAPELLEQENNYRESLLHYASAGANIEVMRYLLNRGLDVNSANSTGWTPLMCALTKTCKASYISGPSRLLLPPKQISEAVGSARLLLSHGANPNVATKEGWTPLHCVASYACSDSRDDADAAALADLTEELIDEGLDLNIGATSLVPGWEQSHRKAVADMALRHPLLWGFRVQLAMDQFPGSTQTGRTPLDWAAQNGALMVAKVLLARGAGRLAVDENRTTPESTAGRDTGA
ncbi:ankyrin repeat-containing domain protein [Nemania sp. FL0031]|nr:ankyrin repeat-containing domain protein [Nemania sp. FL0031]